MAELDLTIGGHHYRVACAEGQEAALYDLAGMLNDTIDAQRAQSGVLGETRQLLFAALTLADALRDTKTELATWHTLSPQLADIGNTARAIDNLAGRVENLATSLENAGQTD